MHRSDAETVSYTEIEVDDSAAVMRYRSGPPRQGLLLSEERILRTPPGGLRVPLAGDWASSAGQRC